MYATRSAAREALHGQPFTLACRARHIVVPCYARNLLGEKLSNKPIGYSYRLRNKGECKMKHNFHIKDSAGHSLGYQSAETAKEAVKLARATLNVPSLSATLVVVASVANVTGTL